MRRGPRGRSRKELLFNWERSRRQGKFGIKRKKVMLRKSKIQKKACSHSVKKRDFSGGGGGRLKGKEKGSARVVEASTLKKGEMPSPRYCEKTASPRGKERGLSL